MSYAVRFAPEALDRPDALAALKQKAAHAPLFDNRSDNTSGGHAAAHAQNGSFTSGFAAVSTRRKSS